ncbi:hypothetical protein N9N03_01555 [Chlamydiia bacterium]|nr:hypothetical protein [Chlamydiia bacterium]
MTRTASPESFIKHYTVTNDEDPSIMNCTGWTKDEYTNLYNQAIHATDKTNYQNMLANAERVLIEEMSVIPLFTETYHYLLKPDIIGLNVDQGGFFRVNYCGHTQTTTKDKL